MLLPGFEPGSRGESLECLILLQYLYVEVSLTGLHYRSIHSTFTKVFDINFNKS